MASCPLLPAVIALVAVDGASIAFSSEVFVLQIFNITERRRRMRVFKAIMALSMAIKIILFLTMGNTLGQTACEVVGKIAASMYHIAIIFGNAALLDRIACIVPAHLVREFVIAHYMILFLRFVIGVVDVVTVVLVQIPHGICTYKDSPIIAPIYTIYDAVTDLYVTLAILTILIKHINNVKSVDDPITNVGLYFAIGVTNVIRTICLMASNILSAAMIISHTPIITTETAWAVTNILFVMLIGHDRDIAAVIRNMYADRNLPSLLMRSSRE